MKRTLPLLLACLLALLLAACGAPSDGGPTPPPTDDGSPTFTRDEFDGAVDETTADVGAALATVAQDPAIVALGSVFTPATMAVYGDGGLAVAAALSAGTEPLPRGVFVYDETDTSSPAYPWRHVGSSDDLVLQWSFTGAASGAASSAELVVDWNATGDTVEADDGSGYLAEVPTGARATLAVDGATVADVGLTAAWYECASAGGPVIEPTLVSVDGSIGGVVDLDAVGFEITDTRAGTSGGVTLGTASEYASFRWNVSANGTPVREDCFLSDFAVDSGSVEFGLETLSGGESDSLEFEVGFSGIGTDETGVVTSVDLNDGAIRVDGATAVTFDGTLDDANGNDVPGDNVTVRFADGTSATLEQLLEGAMPAATALKAAAALLR